MSTKEQASPNAALLRELISAFTVDTDDIAIAGKQSTEIGVPVETLTLQVSRLDGPKVVGGQGRQIQAIRTIFDAIGRRDSQRVRVLLVDRMEGVRPRRADPISRELEGREVAAQYDPEAIHALAMKLLSRLFQRPFTVDIYGIGETVMMEIRVDKAEQELGEALQPYIKSIFNAIGRHQGKELHMELMPAIPVPVGEVK